MKANQIELVKVSGERVNFSLSKLRNSLKRTGANETFVNQIIDKVTNEHYHGISTREIYNRAFALLKKLNHSSACKYKLKKAIYEFGPTGYPFERFVGAILKYSGYEIEIDKVLIGECVKHEIDVIAHKNSKTFIIECKFHGEQGLKCNVKIPLYINSRYQDVKAHWNTHPTKKTKLTEGWVVTNTRFTEDALRYGKCCGLFLLSWDYPKNEGLKDRIDRLGLYPITVSNLLTKKEKQFLLERDIVLCRELKNEPFYLDHLGISEIRKDKILNEISMLCTVMSD